MSNLEELIEKLCPDGVEYKKIGELVDYEQPGNYIVCSTKYSDEYNIPVLTAGQTFILGYINETDGVYKSSKDNPVIIFDDFTAAFKWVDFEFKVKSSAIKILTVNNTLTTIRYIYHVMGFLNISSDEHKRLWIGTYSNIKVPVPPLEVQREIVRILDNFTFLTAELAAELAARQKQYEYYRDLLLTFKPNESTILNERTNELELSGAIHWMKLGDTCVLKAGKAISATEISQNVNDDYIYPCYGGNGLRGYVKNYNQDGEHPIVGRQGALCGNVCYACNKFYATEHAVVVSPSALYNEKFLYYLLDFARLEQYKTAGAQPGLSVARLEKVVLPVPPLEVQQRIVDILNRFDTLCNDISSGLPAEIEARQKQYEYYRDELLTFKELKKEA